MVTRNHAPSLEMGPGLATNRDVSALLVIGVLTQSLPRPSVGGSYHPTQPGVTQTEADASGLGAIPVGFAGTLKDITGLPETPPPTVPAVSTGPSARVRFSSTAPNDRPFSSSPWSTATGRDRGHETAFSPDLWVKLMAAIISKARPVSSGDSFGTNTSNHQARWNPTPQIVRKPTAAQSWANQVLPGTHTAAELKAAHRKVLWEVHPDVSQHSDALAKTAALNARYEQLQSKATRSS